MTEYLGLAYFTEVPVVVWDVQRVGPSTGLPTRTAQGDLTMLYFIGHGDTNHIILIPGSVNECFEFGWKSFNIAEKYQTPVFVLTDLDLGMNQWCDNSFSYPSEKPNRGKILWERDLEKWERINKEEWGRYKDIDGDGITYRTVLGNISAKAAYFTRGTGHDEFGAYSEEADIWKQTLNRLKKKFENVHNDIPEPLLRKKDGKIGLIGMGSTDPAIQEAQDILEKNGIKADYLRIRSLPSGPIVKGFISEHEKVYILELNRDGQLFQVLSLENSEYIDHLTSIAEIDGLPMTAEWVVHHIMEMESK
jgi:2-oxoglutarate ferredoxin oxidoreductase subunit alpha